jgi:hypothetical protein
MTAAIARAGKAFGRFWIDFLVGDTPELFVVALVIVGVAFALSSQRIAATVVLPLLAFGAVVWSAARGRTTPRN